MTKLKLLSAALIATAMFATPAVARTSHVTSPHRATDANASASPTAFYIDGSVGISAPRVGAFPPAPADGENCDVGDNPHIC
jgi:methionine-rich copper-binding protein CopC